MDKTALALLSRTQELVSQARYREALDLVSGVPIELGGQPEPASDLLRLRFVSLNALGKWIEMVELGAILIPLVPKPAGNRLLCDLHGYLGLAHIRLGSFREAESHLRAAIHVSTWDLVDAPQALFHQRQLGVMFKNLGRWQQAKHEVLNAVVTADEIKSAKESGLLRQTLAIVYLKSGEYREVPQLLDEAEIHLASVDEPLRIIRVHLARARYLVVTGHHAQALEILVQVLPTTREQKYSREEAITLEYMGDCYLAQRDHEKALEHYNLALKIAEATAPRGDLIPELGHRIGEALVNLGDPNAAILSCERGLRLAREIGDRYEECATHRVLAMANLAAGNPRKALRIGAEGIELARSYEIPYELGRALMWAGEARHQGSTLEERALGRRQLWEARATFDRIGLSNWTRPIEKLLGLESQPEPSTDEPGIAALSGIEKLDRGALKFGIVTCDVEVSEAVATIQSVAPSKIPVLITGPSGVGKELLARAIHQMSDRRKEAFVAVNCGALSPSLIDSELFGHERGAFTGAVTSREGLFVSADHGTLFLDEVGDLSPAAQATLLRVLETGELRPLGRDEVRTIDVRIVAATNANVEALVERGTFRRDLFFRLNGVSVTVPALADREEDIRALFRFFWAQAVSESGKRLTLAEDVEGMLCSYAWPGNVRELRNEIARAVAMAASGTVITRDAFLPRQRSKSASALRKERDNIARTADEREEILQALRAHSGNKADAARSLGGMKRTTLIYKMERLGIRPEEYGSEK
jgi:DNA-binding NtrC family response regulator/tetratricopeptide (TPR) repeat protein